MNFKLEVICDEEKYFINPSFLAEIVKSAILKENKEKKEKDIKELKVGVSRI